MKVFISHIAQECGLAGAWKELLRRISHGAVEVWSSGNQEESVAEQIAEAEYVLAILTPRSLESPWILWECALARGLGKAVIVPLLYGCSPDGPLAALPAAQADDRDEVLSLCRRILRAAGLTGPATRDWEPALDAYFDAVRMPMHSLKLLRRIALGRRWHVDDAIRSGEAEALAAIAGSEGELPPAQAFEVHSRLGQLYADRQQLPLALEAVEKALTIAPGDPCLLLRQGMILLDLNRGGEVKRIITQLGRLDPASRTDPEVACLEGRLGRQLYEQTGDRSHLVSALKACRRAYEKHPDDCLTGADYATLSLMNGDSRAAVRVARALVGVCQAMQEQGSASFRIDFALAEAFLILGDFERARQEYVRGLVREPRPTARALAEALKRLRTLLPEHDLPDLEVLLK